MNKNEPVTAVQPQKTIPSNVNELFRPPDIGQTCEDIDTIIDGNEKQKVQPHPELLSLKNEGLKACKGNAIVEMDINSNERVAVAEEHVGYIKQIIDRIEMVFDAPRDYLHKVKAYVLKRRDDMTSELEEVRESLKTKISSYATAKALKIQKENEEAIAKAAEKTREKQKAIEERAKKWENKGKPEKAEQIREEVETAEVMPNIIPEDPKNWTAEAIVTNKLVFLIEYLNSSDPDLTGIEIKKKLLNQVAMAKMSRVGPRKTIRTDWGYIKCEKKK